MRHPTFPLVLILVASVVSCGERTAVPPTPTIDIVTPVEGDLLSVQRVRVQGVAEHVDRIDVGGVNAEVVGGEWEAMVPVEQGEVTIVASGGGAEDEVTITVDSRPPALEVSTPSRAKYQSIADGEVVRVSGTVSDEGTGLEILKVNEQIIQPAVSGAWQHDLALRPGLNEITVVARDVAGNEVSDIRGVLYGDTIAPMETISPAFNIWIDQQSIPVLQEVVQGFLTPHNVTVMLAGYLNNDAVSVETLAFDPVQFDIALRPDVIDLSFEVTNLEVGGTFTIGGDPLAANVAIARFRIRVEATPLVLDDGGLTMRFSEPTLELSPEDLSYDIAGLSDEDSEFLEEQIIDIAQSGFSHVLTQGLFESFYDPAILKRKVAIFGREIVFDLQLDAMDVHADGILIRTEMMMPTERWPAVRDDAPGALHRAPGPGTTVQTVEDVQFTVTRNAADRILNGIWYSGLLHYELQGDDFAGVTLPFELNAGALAAAFGAGITSVAPAETPAALRLRPMFPPIAEYDVDNARLLIELGELMIDLVLLPAGEDPIVVATISTFLDLSLTLAVEGVLVKLGFQTELRADLAEEPVTDLDDEQAEELLESVVSLIPTLVAQELVLQGEQDITWVRLEPPRVEVHGANRDYATISLGMVANPQELPPPDPAPDPDDEGP